MLTLARTLAHSGVSCIPINEEKRPFHNGELLQWKPYQSRPPTDHELTEWFSNAYGIAIISGKAQCLDIDTKNDPTGAIYSQFLATCEELGYTDILQRCLCQKTPSGGIHYVWLSDDRSLGNLKLARDTTHKTLIETRGEGGYFGCAPTAGYQITNDTDFTQLPLLSNEDRACLLEAARMLDRVPVKEFVESTPRTPQKDGHQTPGDAYDNSGQFFNLLRRHGWHSRNGTHWTRPEKKRGISATWNIVPNRFYVFTTSTVFENEHCYRPWHCYAILEHGGDFKKAASALAREGLGDPLARKTHNDVITAADLGMQDSGMQLAPRLHEDEEQGMQLAPSEVSTGGEKSDLLSPQTVLDDKEAALLREALKQRKYDPSKVPPPLRPIYTLTDIPICTPANLTAISAQAKAGKSSFVSAMIAAAIAHPYVNIDSLGVKSSNHEGKAIVYIDTEQAPDDFWHMVKRSEKRAKRGDTPEWLLPYNLAGLAAKAIRKALVLAIKDAAKAFGGIHSVFIDGVADLVCDVNNAEESNGLASELHALAIGFDCPIINIIHLNPGSDKERGHLGSQLARKAETNLKIDKEDNVSLIWSEKQRRAPIFKNNAIRFQWSDELSMHVSIDRKPAGGGLNADKLDMLRDTANRAFEGIHEHSYVALCKAIKEVEKNSIQTAERRVKLMLDNGIISKDSDGKYFLINNE